VLVLFFIAFSALQCMLKDRKLTPGLAASVVTVLAFYHTGPGSTPGVRKYFCTFFSESSVNYS